MDRFGQDVAPAVRELVAAEHAEPGRAAEPAAVTAPTPDPGVRLTATRCGTSRAVDLLTDTPLSHLSYEESTILEPLARQGFYDGQL
ncbi:MAG TPA: hypothetical protein VHV74_11865 [Pseudonocardiaceae bacterium]|nr:hypothetical protein [Pseudonocardiaceae bacterium]